MQKIESHIDCLLTKLFVSHNGDLDMMINDWIDEFSEYIGSIHDINYTCCVGPKSYFYTALVIYQHRIYKIPEKRMEE